jgi:UDP-N-acetyl-D-galactosamine dehydrogenase
MSYNHQIAIVGLGYVGLPLALEFSKKYPVLGFDISNERVSELNNGIDRTKEANEDDLLDFTNSFVHRWFTNEQIDGLANGELDGKAADTVVVYEPLINMSKGLTFSTNPIDLSLANTYIVTVPTPIDNYKKPDLTPLLKASESIGRVLKRGDIVIYESTVYPGCTEEDCVPVLEKMSGLKFNEDFFCGYSPERINPGDKINTLTKIKKVTSGSTPEIAKIVNDLYASIILAGTHLAPSLKVAEASKAIENAQRDVNISFVNELALIFDRMGIDTNDVIEAASTKWNFLKYKPGLVGGHCIGVDPYYLAHKAESLGYHPEVILSGRRVNDHMGQFVANKVIKLMIKKNHKINGAKALIIGFAFKENCPDIRNSRVIDIHNELEQFGLDVDVYDPWVNKEQVKLEYGIDLIDTIHNSYDALILAVSHDEFNDLDLSLMTNCNTVIFDSKSVMPRDLVDGRL